MNLLGNIIWLVFGGLAAALGYVLGGFFLCITIVGLPWGLQCFKLAGVVLWPFGKSIVPKEGATGCLSFFCNLVWLLCGGLYTSLVHLFFAAIFFITIIGIPFARQHLKLMELSLLPFSRNVI
ncbi:YccF domain-containing protein [Longitalea luteola]|uniref:YccF domain-containing protein n=1 Tax=Longitalea luteola TaxID=2812563 RepID=UPI001A9750DF|nr:YccF domain-containing protein [Longitalea luteola]